MVCNNQSSNHMLLSSQTFNILSGRYWMYFKNLHQSLPILLVTANRADQTIFHNTLHRDRFDLPKPTR